MPSATQRLSRVPLFSLLAGSLALGVAAPAAAGQVDYFLKIEGVDGESAGKDHKKWIDVLSIDWGTARAPSSAERKGKKGNVEATWKVEEAERTAPPAPGASGLAAPDTGSSEASLLLPAVQKVRASVKGSYPGCREGMHHDQVVATASDGRRIVMKDVMITSCSAAKVQFVYSKPH